MICPLLSISEDTFLDCREGECAWWDEYDGRCSVNVLSNDERARRLAQAAITKKRIENENTI